MAQIHQVQSKGIFHGLPAHDDSQSGLTAVVCGASGISGAYMLRVLAESPQRWKKIYALSRRPPVGDWPPNIEHVSVDLLKSPQSVAEVLQEKQVKPDHVFFFAYIQPEPKPDMGLWSNAEELCQVNLSLVRTFCEALEIARALPKRFLIQYGAKYYGVHLGPIDVPQVESAPRVELEPNFYYDQEDFLRSFCGKHDIGLYSTRPGYILGAVPDAAMNLCYPLALYALVQKYLGRPLDFPAGDDAWELTQAFSSARLTGYLAEWIVLNRDLDGASSGDYNRESFNAVDDSAFAWCGFWPRLAAWAGIEEWNGPVGGQDDEDAGKAGWIVAQTRQVPAPRYSGRPGTVRFRFDLVEWAKRDEVQQAYREIAEKYGLREKSLRDEQRIFEFAQMALIGPSVQNFSTTKAKKLGYFGYVDTAEAMLQVFDEFADIGMLPRRDDFLRDLQKKH